MCDLASPRDVFGTSASDRLQGFERLRENSDIQTNLPARCGFEVSPGKVTSLTAMYSPVTNLKGLVTSGSSSEPDILESFDEIGIEALAVR